MLSCVVYGCTNNSITSNSSIKYHQFPKTALAQEWAEACGWQSCTLDLDAACVCSIHFEETAYKSKIKMVDFVACYSKTLRCDAVPTLHLPNTQIIIKDNSLELESDVVVYTINPTDSDNGITTISLEDGTGEKQIFQLQPSTSHIKLETKKESNDHSEKYNDVKSYPDLYLLQANNKSLKRKIEILENDLKTLQKDLNDKENECAKFEGEFKNVGSKKNDINMLSQHEQKAILSKVFSEAQIKILFGKKKVYWSNDDMAVGYIIRHLGNKRCYSYLTKNLNIPLPGVSSIKRWVSKKNKRIRR